MNIYKIQLTDAILQEESMAILIEVKGRLVIENDMANIIYRKFRKKVVLCYE